MKSVTLGVLLSVYGAGASLAQLPDVPYPSGNPYTPEKAVLGKILFWEEQLSSDNTVACGTCHVFASGGADPREDPEAIHPGPDGLLGTGDDVFGSFGVRRMDGHGNYQPDPVFGFGRQVTRRRAPSILLAPFAFEVLWDGRANITNPSIPDPAGLASLGSLELQAMLPPINDVEMAHAGSSWNDIVAKLAVVEPLGLATEWPRDVAQALTVAPTYPELFRVAFGSPEITLGRVARALATYQRTLIPDQTPLDLGALTEQQTDGLALFNSVNLFCFVCHSGSLFTSTGFENIGLRPPVEDLGRQLVSGFFVDRGKFKVPSLRNAGLRKRFFHTGGAESLEEVVDFYVRGGDFAENQDLLVDTREITASEKADLLAFLRDGLTDPRVANELPPFDRPTLFSERGDAQPIEFGAGTLGSAGFLPAMLADSPPHVGTPGYRIGVHGGLGGAVAFLVAVESRSHGGPSLSSPLRPVRRRVLRRLILSGSGPGNGYATVHLPLEDPRLRGSQLELQWLILDPGAQGGLASTPRIRLTIF